MYAKINLKKIKKHIDGKGLGVENMHIQIKKECIPKSRMLENNKDKKMFVACTQGQQEKCSRQMQQLKDEFGEACIHLLNDADIKEIMLNPDGRIWFEHKRDGMQETNIAFSYNSAYKLITTVADLCGKIINRQQPILETQLPIFKYRFSAIIPDVVDFPVFCIRKNIKKLFSLSEYVVQGVLTEQQLSLIHCGINARNSILIAGGPGTGKTTLANAILAEMVQIGDANQRIVIIEDTRELSCSASNCVYLKTTRYADFNQLLKSTLRMRPDKICLGECRGAETSVLLKAWNTGTQGGLATIHANNAISALDRMEELSASEGSSAIKRLISIAVKMIVALEFNSTYGRKITEIVRVNDYKNGEYQLEKFC